MRVLAGDIGGTNARLAVFQVEGERYEVEVEETFPSRDYASLVEVVQTFLAGHGVRCRSACFGVPGPVMHGRAQTTNLPWLVEASRLAEGAGIPRVAILNDLEAQAHGIATLAAGDLLTLNGGRPDASGNRALIAAGTGLGQAGLYWDGQTHRPFATEGGHASFAPETELQFALRRHLGARFGHVSWERVVSGPGLVNIYEFLLEYRGVEEANRLAAAAISEAALAGRSGLCSEALDLFVELYGVEAGNLALKIMATGGLYIGGGIAPRIVEKLQGPVFLEAFLAHGRMRPLLEVIPVRVILNERTALRGAARYAACFEGPGG